MCKHLKYEFMQTAVNVYIDPSALEIKHSSIGLSIGSKFNIFVLQQTAIHCLTHPRIVTPYAFVEHCQLIGQRH